VVRLTAAWQEFVLNEAAFVLGALGRLTEAVEPMQAGLGAAHRREDWENAAAAAASLSELTLTLGDVARAVTFGEQSVELADRTDNAFQRMVNRTTWADALHQAGLWEESAAKFRKAESFQAERQPEFRRLYLLQGFQYCDLLISRAEPETGSLLDGLSTSSEDADSFWQACQKVLERGHEAQEIVLRGSRTLLDIALNHLTLGRAHLGLAVTSRGEDRPAGLAQAAELLDRSVTDLRRAGQEDHIPPRPPGPRVPSTLLFQLFRRRRGPHRGSGDCRAWADAAA
jgi:hypothetical protein